MKSRITIDVDENNNPIIKVQYEESDDLRDKFVKRFLEGFKSESSWAQIKFDSPLSQNLDNVNKVLIISPLSVREAYEQVPEIKKRHDDSIV